GLLAVLCEHDTVLAVSTHGVGRDRDAVVGGTADPGPVVVGHGVPRQRDVAGLLHPHAVTAPEDSVGRHERVVVGHGVPGHGDVVRGDVEPQAGRTVVVEGTVGHGEVGRG